MIREITFFFSVFWFNLFCGIYSSLRDYYKVLLEKWPCLYHWCAVFKIKVSLSNHSISVKIAEPIFIKILTSKFLEEIVNEKKNFFFIKLFFLLLNCNCFWVKASKDTYLVSSYRFLPCKAKILILYRSWNLLCKVKENS